jgi:hypothetical protein
VNSNGEPLLYAEAGQSCVEKNTIFQKARPCVSGLVCLGGFNILGIYQTEGKCGLPDASGGQNPNCGLNPVCHMGNFVNSMIKFVQELLFSVVIWVIVIAIVVFTLIAILQKIIGLTVGQIFKKVIK